MDFTCGGCNEKKEVDKFLTINPSAVMIITMKRFSVVEGESAKITKHVDCPLNDLDLGP